MEMLLLSAGSKRVAGAKGRLARNRSSAGRGGGGASDWMTPTVAFGALPPSSVSVRGGSMTAGRVSALSIVWMSVVVEDVVAGAAVRSRGALVEDAGCEQAASAAAAANSSASLAFAHKA